MYWGLKKFKLLQQIGPYIRLISNFVFYRGIALKR